MMAVERRLASIVLYYKIEIIVQCTHTIHYLPGLNIDVYSYIYYIITYDIMLVPILKPFQI